MNLRLPIIVSLLFLAATVAVVPSAGAVLQANCEAPADVFCYPEADMYCTVYVEAPTGHWVCGDEPFVWQAEAVARTAIGQAMFAACHHGAVPDAACNILP